MAIRDITIDVDFAKKDILTKFNVKQFDNANLTINTFLDSVEYNPIGNTCKFYVGIDDDLFLQEENIQVQENKIVIELDKNMISKSGMAYAELELKDSEGIMTSITFIFYVEKKIGEGATIPGNIEGFVERYERLIKEFKQQVDSTVNDCNTRVDNKLVQLQNDYSTTKNTTIKSIEDKTDKCISDVNKAIASGTVDLETKEARDGEVSLNKRLIRDKQELSTRISEIDEVVAYDYSSENNYINIKNSKEGTLDNVRIEGNTLVNLLHLVSKGTSSVTFDGLLAKGNIDNSQYYFISTSLPKVGGTYTVVVDGIDGEAFKYAVNYVDTTDTLKILKNYDSSTNAITITIPKDYNGGLRIYVKNYSGSLQTIKSGQIRLMVLEGDYTQNPPSYFEGLKSVGELEELEIDSVKSDGNLLNLDNISNYNAEHNISDGDITVKSNIDNAWSFTTINDVKVVPGEIYSIAFDSVEAEKHSRIYIVDGNKNILLDQSNLVGGKYYQLKNSETRLININVCASSTATLKGTTVYRKMRLVKKEQSYSPYKSDKKKLLYKDVDGTWKPIVLRKWDYIEELSDGRCKYHRCSVERMFDGNESWGIAGRQFDNCMCFFLTSIDNNKNIKGGSFISDKFVYDKMAYSENRDIECISNNSNPNDTFIVIQIAKSKLATQDVEGFKAWLQANPVTIVYQLAQEEVYDCIDLSLNSYNGETSVFTNSSIPHKLTVTQKQGLKARVETLEQEMKFLYDNFREGLQKVLAGDMQSLAYMLYPQDFTDYDNNDTDENIPITIPNLK